MYQYSDHNEHNDISLHDCRAAKLIIGQNTVTFVFETGIYVLESNSQNYNNQLSYTEEAEVVFRTKHRDIRNAVTVYLFTETADSDRAIRESVSPAALAEMLGSGMELEFLYAYQGYQSWLFTCWLWSDAEPYHRECEIIISAEEVTYYWNALHPEE